ncbi:MAG: hypothetical protein VXY00_07500 [Candidatus Latescibacterota bacterium]|nr:hypothetical protein [Candidatus Latescibacterota bacterium]MEC8646805.1 hypothetical protein [Candidatus Latescibacterota bacterium]MEE2627065.1 hypothetical protein [Candidatus Latescibacterota bacterium]MEE2726154.1 hypothetical protein [Candidatus Latescibacterota bacterium]
MISKRAGMWIEVLLLVAALGVLGVWHFSQLSPEHERYIALEAGLEQLYWMELAHYKAHGRYFDPTDSREGLDWTWTDQYDWEVRIGAEKFWFVVRADLNRDGRMGAWVMDQEGPQMRNLMDD